MNDFSHVEIKDTDIAIIGMSCRFPGANNLETFWQNLRDGVESISFFSDEELEVSDRRLLLEPNYVKACPILSDVESFDASFFGISAKEASLMDPQQRLFLECAWEAFENAGINCGQYEGLVGVYAGSGMNSYLINNIHPNRDFSPNRTFLDSVSDLQVRLGNDKDHLATRVSYKLNLKGPSVNVQTACSTALVAVHLACQALQNGECDMALAGCMNIILPQKTGYLYQENMIFSPDGHCRAFDAQAQGTLFGNGGGAVVLKLLGEAIADGDDIVAVIKGSAINNDGSLKVGYTAPSVDGQAAVIFDALSVAEVDASTISYVEAHGTGTPLGDPIEIAALTQAFHASTENGLARNSCAIGSVKTNIGHLTEAAGMAGLIKSALALQAQLIPATLHFTEPNPNIDFESGPFYVNTALSEWKTYGIPRRAGVSAFGMGGTNAHLVLEEAPQKKILNRSNDFSRSGPGTTEVVTTVHDLFTLSAKSDKALQELAQRYETYLDSHPDISLADLCFTANTGRQHFSHRLAIVTSSITQLREQLATFSRAEGGSAEMLGVFKSQIEGQIESRRSSKKIGFLFTGQGSQYVGMGRQLYEREPVFREMLEQCDDILSPLLGRSLLDILYSSDASQYSVLDQTAYTQPALFALEYALAELWKSWGIEPDYVLGHSVGEIVAACVAGVFSLEDGLYLIAERGRLMQALPQGGEMVAVLASEAQVTSAIQPVADMVEIAAINGPESVVISGAGQAVQAVCATLEAQGIKTRRLKVSHAFHSPLMEPMLDAFHAVARQVSFAPPQTGADRFRVEGSIQLISNVTGGIATDEVATPEYWCRHVRQAVQFAAGMESLVQEGVDIFVEIGPKPILLGMGQRCLPNHASMADHNALWLPSLHPKRDDGRSHDKQQILTSLASAYVHGVDVSWAGFFDAYAQERQRLHLPTYPFQRKRYWIEPATHSTVPAHRQPREQSHPSHPLLGQRLQLAGTPEIRFESQISRQEIAFLADSSAQEPLPMTAYLEMALAAGAKAQESNQESNQESDQITVEDVFIQQPLFLREHDVTRLQVVLKAANPVGQTTEHDGAAGAFQFEIYSLTHDLSHGSLWTLHTVGLLREGGPEEIQPLNLVLLQAQCDEEFPLSLFYEQATAYGLDYAPTHPAFEDSGAEYGRQAIKQLWRGRGAERPSALGRIRATNSSVRVPASLSADEYQFHPALLDLCCQVFVATFPSGALGEETGTYVPMGVESLTLYVSPRKAEELWSYAQMRSPNPSFARTSVGGAELLTGNVHIFDESGKPIAFVAGFSMRRTTREVRKQAIKHNVTPTAFTSSWEKPEQSALLEQLANTPVKERWNLLATEVRAVVGQVLGTDSSGDSSEWLALQQGFFDYGMDSFTSIELRNRLQNTLGCALPTTLAFTYPTIESLVNYLAEEVLSLEFAPQSEVEPQEAPAEEEAWKEVGELSEAEAEAWLLEELQALDYYWE